MPGTLAPLWARELRKDLIAEIALIESGEHRILEAEVDVSAAALTSLKARLMQVQNLIDAFEG